MKKNSIANCTIASNFYAPRDRKPVKAWWRENFDDAWKILITLDTTYRNMKAAWLEPWNVEGFRWKLQDCDVKEHGDQLSEAIWALRNDLSE